MSDANLPLSTDPADFCFFDTETRSKVDVTVGGGYRHNAEGRVVILTYALGLGPVQEWCLTDWTPGRKLDWTYAPVELVDFWRRAAAGKAWFVAWNAAFDRLSVNRGTYVPPNTGITEPLRIDMVIDAMAQAVVSHYPPDLAGASARGNTIKDSGGKRLIRLFCDEAGEATPQSHPEDWAAFRSYARDDVAAMRDIFLATLPLPRREWEEYWTSERINDRGLPIDERFAAAASEVAEHAAEIANERVAEISGGALYSVNQHDAILKWVVGKLGEDPAVVDILTKELVDGPPDEDGNDTKVAKMSLERGNVEQLIAWLLRRDEEQGLTDDEADALDMLEVRLYGASATPRKFTKMLPMLESGRLKGQYVFSGAAATGRFSSRGIQTHNLTRSVVETAKPTNRPPDEIEFEAIEAVMSGGLPEKRYALLEAQYGPVGRTLSRLIRPTICAEPGKVLVWGDWSAIEARVLPWLAGSPGAEEVLDAFRENDADPGLPDIYQRQAGSILRKNPTLITKKERQSHGKVPVLSLGFGGGNGALHAMASGYGVSFTEDEATGIVRGWRDANTWARAFWNQLWEAALAAMENPGKPYGAGRVTYLYAREYMGGTLFCELPCNRLLRYPFIKWEKREVKDRKTGELKMRESLTYRRGYGRSAIWYGTLAENITQAFAGSLMRAALVRLDPTGWVVGHTHDEIVLEVDERDAGEAVSLLQREMNHVPGFAAGLPLTAGVVSNEYYTKTAD